MIKKSINNKVVHELKGFLVVTPTNTAPPTPLACPVCNFLLKDQRDVMSYKDFGCCDECSLKWAQCRRTKWESGWRPSNEEISEEIKFRASRITYVVKSA